MVVATESGDSDACRKLVEAFLPAIARVARGFRSGIGVQRQELIQEGVAGLLFAAQRYDPRLNTPFWAYASFWVRKAMQELVAELTRPVSLSDRAVRGLAQVRSARQQLTARGTEPTNEELMTVTGLTRAQLESLLATERSARSLQEDLRGGEPTSVGESIVDLDAEQAYDHVLDRIEMEELSELAGRLDERERAVVRAHYGLGEAPRTLNEIGRTLGLTAERARQIEVGALGKLREALARPARWDRADLKSGPRRLM
jgi:RNA polymerase sigma factor (sigma-70 family)